LQRHEPATASKLRTIESMGMTPIRPLVASSSTPPDTVERLRRALSAAAGEPEAASLLEFLLLAGFAPAAATDYDRLLAQAREAISAGYPVPA
jgi:ABC-type phosphate/phosphonate transport system substrate-binding protein